MSKIVSRLFSFAAMSLRGTARLCLMAWYIVFVAFLFALSPLVFLIVLALMLPRRQRSGEADTTHGSARWANTRDLSASGCLSNDGVPAGRTLSFQTHTLLQRCLTLFRLSWHGESSADDVGARHLCIPDRYPHVAVFGASGSGKSTCFSVPLLFQSAENMVVLDPKGELCRLTANARAQQFGHRIVVLDPFGVSEGCGFERDCLNPLTLAAGNEERLVDNARRLADAMVVTTGRESDPYWNESGATVLTSTLAFLMTSARPEEANLNRMRDILTNAELMDQMLNFMSQSDQCAGLLQRISGQVNRAEGRTKSSIYSVAAGHTAFLDSIAVAQTVAATSFDPNDLINGRMTIYLCLPVDRLSSLTSLQRVLMTTLINLVFEAGENSRRRVRFLLDEAATLESMPALYSAVMYGRSYGLRLCLLYQSAAQVARSFPDAVDDFRATVATVALGAQDFESAEALSKWIGSSTVHSNTYSTGTSSGSSQSMGTSDQSTGQNWGNNQSQSHAATGRPLIMPEEILQLPRNLVIILLAGMPPILAEKVAYFSKRPGTKCGLFFGPLICGTIIAATAFLLPEFVEFVLSGNPGWAVHGWLTQLNESLPD